METKRGIRSALLLLLALLVGITASFGEDAVAVGKDGTVYRVKSGTYETFFSNGVEAAPGDQVLVLEALKADVRNLFLIPETASLYTNKLASLHYEQDDEADTLYIMWQNLLSGIHPVLHLVSFDGVQFSDAIQIVGNPFADKGNPQFVISRDSSPFLKSANSGRALINVVWWEDAGSMSRKRFVPLLLEKGSYQRFPTTIGLEDLVTNEEVSPPEVSSTDPLLADLVAIRPGSKSEMVVIGFYHPNNGHVVVVEVELLPLVLSQLAARVTEFVHDEIADGKIGGLAERVRNEILRSSEDGFHPGSLQFLAEQVWRLILEELPLSEQATNQLQNKMGPSIIRIGSRFKANGLETVEPLQIIELDHDNSSPAHIKISLLGEWDAPNVGGKPELYLSSTGREALVAWDSGEAVQYRETWNGSWAEVHTIELSDELGRSDIYTMLANRISRR